MGIDRLIDESDSSYKKYIYWISGALFVGIVLWILFLPNHLESARNYIEEGQYDLAIESFKKVPAGSHNGVLVMQGIEIAKALKAYSNSNWREAITILGSTSPVPAYEKQYNFVRDSAQHHIEDDSLLLIMPRLKYSVMESKDDKNILDILTYIGGTQRVQEKVKLRYQNGQLIVDHSRRIALNIKKYSLNLDEILSKKEELRSQVGALRSQLENAIQQGIRWRSFMIEKQFDVDHSEGTPRPVYSGMSMSEQSEVVVIANEGEVPNGIYERMGVQMLVKSVGNKEYTKSNMYGYSTTVFLPTFESVDKDQDPAKIRKEGLKVAEQLRSLSVAEDKIKASILAERKKALDEAINELKSSNW